MTEEKSILLIDGLNCFVKNFVVSEAINQSGDLIGGATGFLRSIKGYVERLNPGSVFVVWEQGGGSPRRKHIYPEYKAHRAKDRGMLANLYKANGKINPMADENNRNEQLLLLTKALNNLPVCQLYVQDTECDDIIAWLVQNKFKTYTGIKYIASTDKDFYQLLEDPTVRVFNTSTKLVIDTETVLTEYKISPRNLTLARSVVGDSSDGISGVEGIGLKTMARRFAALAEPEKDLDVEWLVNESKLACEAFKLKTPKCYNDIISNEQTIRRNWDLMYLNNSNLAASHIAKINYRIDEFKPALDYLGYLKSFSLKDITITKEIESVPSALRCLIQK